MELIIRIYTTQGNYKSSRSINLNEGELDGMIKEYLEKEGYTKESEIINEIHYENVKL